MKVYQWFYWNSNPQLLEKCQPCSLGPKAVLFRLAKFLLEALAETKLLNKNHLNDVFMSQVGYYVIQSLPVVRVTPK
jgi:hypothetical protein